MKPFIFSLEAVLTMRVREEQLATEAWGHAVQAQTRAEQALEAATKELDNARQMLTQKRTGRFGPGDQTLYLNAIANQETTCKQLAEALHKAIQLTKTRQASLVSARMKREVMERLKQKKMNQHRRGIQAMEAAAIDDLIIVRHRRREAAL